MSDLCRICRVAGRKLVGNLKVVLNVSRDVGHLYLDVAGPVCDSCADALKAAPAGDVRARLESALLRVVADVKRGKMRPPT